MRTLKGTIVSTKMKKTVVVSVPLIREHKKYKKTYTIKRRFKAHVDTEDFNEGDFVLIQEIPPMSREKRWKVVQKLTKSN